MDVLKGYGLVRASKKTGRVDTAMTAVGFGVLQLWGLQNTPKSKISIVFELDTGIIRSRYTGDESGFPNVEHGIEARGEKIDEEIRRLLEAQETRVKGGKGNG